MRAVRPLFSTLLLLALAACVTPTTDNPDVTQAEWQQEMRLQEQAALKAPIDFNEKKPYGKNQVAALANRLGPIAARIERASESLCHDIFMPNKVCEFKVILDPGKRGLNAHADGQNVVIYPAMIDFARNDNHLAFVLAHEFAHNLMQHVAAQRQNITFGAILGTAVDIAASSGGANTQGVFGKIGQEQAALQYSAAFEAEADYVGLYILARAGYRIEEAPDFWRIMSQAQPNAIYVTSSHPNNPARTIAMTKTVAEIRAKQRARQPLIPNIRRREG